MRQEGIVRDENGWASPERTWYSLYNPGGQLLLTDEASSRPFDLRALEVDEGYFSPLTSQLGLLFLQHREEVTQTNSGTCTLFNLQTGKTLGPWEGKNLYISPLYYYAYSAPDPISRGCLLMSRRTAPPGSSATG